jgi:hypothetical protein
MLCLLALVGCGKKTGEPTGTVLVAMADNSYSPAIVRVPVESSIVFINTGRNVHNAIAVDKSWSSESTFGNIENAVGRDDRDRVPRPRRVPLLLQLSCISRREGRHDGRRCW